MTFGVNPALQDLLAAAARQNAAGQLDAAAVSYSRALSLAPDNAEIANNLGVALWAQGRLDDAVAAFCRAIQLRPDFAEAHNNLGTALRDSGLPEEARGCFETALAIAAHKRNLPPPREVSIDAEADLMLADDGHFLRVRLKVGLGGVAPDVAQMLITEAHAVCPYSRAMRGNVDVAISLVAR